MQDTMGMMTVSGETGQMRRSRRRTGQARYHVDRFNLDPAWLTGWIDNYGGSLGIFICNESLRNGAGAGQCAVVVGCRPTAPAALVVAVVAVLILLVATGVWRSGRSVGLSW